MVQIGKRAAEYGVTASLRYFYKAFTGRMWKLKYNQLVTVRRRAGGDMTMKELASKKPSRPLILGEDLDKQ